MSIEELDTISLFSGCGGLDIGAEAAGARIVFANDNDHDSCETLRSYFDSDKVFEGDISEIKKFPKAELVIGGYPCQSFSMGGNRNPEADSRSYLFLEYARCVNDTSPRYFIAENVSGLKKIKKGNFLEKQITTFQSLGKAGYRVSAQVLDAKEYGVPQTRKRLFMVGVRADLGKVYHFPNVTHGKIGKRTQHLQRFTSHGDVIRDLPIWPKGEFYERPHDPEGHWSWYYMSRNRKAPWHGPSYTIVANWRHITVHPASPKMTLTWSNLADGWKQRWDFSDEHEHLEVDDSLPVLPEPRRLSWRECARIQTFPPDFEPIGDPESKFSQIGNAVPPILTEIILRSIISGSGLIDKKYADSYGKQLDLSFGTAAHAF